jgi:hypothetical protein
MTRILSTLAVLDVLALLASVLTGVMSRSQEAATNAGDALYLIHFTVGLFTAIGTLLVHCIIFTYFLGTGRWVKEVKLAYGLPDEPWPKLTRELKRRTFPPALMAMLVTIAAAAAGAGTQLKEWNWQIHFGLSVTSLAVNLWAFYVEFRDVRINANILIEVLLAVDHKRADLGLPSNAEALEKNL